MNLLLQIATLIAAMQVCTIASGAEIKDKLVVEDIDAVEWWKKTNLYHIYVRSFRDSNATGQGDLPGIVEKLDYLKQIGVETLLLSPFYSSPMADAGYDIDDYLQVNERYGTMSDFDKLVEGLRARNMRIVLDFVPNHTSDQHKWFKCSERALVDPENCGKYKDYYVWTDSKRYLGKLPTNWKSVFGDAPAWTWSPIRKAFYLHQFLPQQPDVNMRNPAVVEEFKNIARFWLARGADGLRVDASSFQFEDTENWADQAPNPEWTKDQIPYESQLHTATRALPESGRILKEWRDVATKEFGGDKVIIIEAYDAVDVLIADYGPTPSERYCDMPFNFDLLTIKNNTLQPDHMRKLLSTWLEATVRLGWPKERGGARSPWSCYVTGNHDNTRIVNRLGKSALDWYRWIAYMAPGVPVNYYGDEIGLHDSDFSKIPPSTLAEGEPTRLVFRAPMAWTDEQPSGGFSSSANTWMPMNEDYRQNNVRTLLAAQGKNTLKNFMQLQQLRQERIRTFVFGDLVMFPSNSPSIFSMARTHHGFGSLLMVVNLDKDTRANASLLVAPKSILDGETDVRPPKSGEVVMTNFETLDRPLESKQVQLDDLELEPMQAVMISY